MCVSTTFDLFREQFFLVNHDFLSCLTSPKKDNGHKVWSVLSLVCHFPYFNTTLGITMSYRELIFTV